MVEHLQDKPSGLSVERWLSEVMKTNNLNPVLKKWNFTLNGLPALRVLYQAHASQIDETYVVAHAQTFSISFSGEKRGGSLKSFKNHPIYLKMLASFRVHH